MWFDDNKHVLGTVGMCILIMQVRGPSEPGRTPAGEKQTPGSQIADPGSLTSMLRSDLRPLFRCPSQPCRLHRALFPRIPSEPGAWCWHCVKPLYEFAGEYTCPCSIGMFKLMTELNET